MKPAHIVRSKIRVLQLKYNELQRAGIIAKAELVKAEMDALGWVLQ